MTLFEHTTIQTIIDFKWVTYTKGFYLKQFKIFMIFVMLFFVDLILISKNPSEDTQEF